MKRAAYLITLPLLLQLVMALPGKADDASAKLLFERGVSATTDQRWEDAVELFEASLAESAKPATSYNLVLANRELNRPLEVVRHALAFLAYSEGAARSDAEAYVREVLSAALAQVSVLTTSALPLSAQLFVDGQPPRARDQERVLVLPGPHHLELRRVDGVTESTELDLRAGQTLPWPQGCTMAGGSSPSSPALASSPLTNERTLPPARRRSPKSRMWAALALGVGGAAFQLSAVGVYFGVRHQAEHVAQLDPTEAGFLHQAEELQQLRKWVIPLAATGGALLTSAVATGATSARMRGLVPRVTALAVASVLAGVGVAMMVREPSLLGQSSLHEPTREAGSLLLTSSLPLLTYGLCMQFSLEKSR